MLNAAGSGNPLGCVVGIREKCRKGFARLDPTNSSSAIPGDLPRGFGVVEFVAAASITVHQRTTAYNELFATI